ncbi:MAG: restriction endonuclease subunit S [Sphingobacteriaceae bacterium]|nr:MAG: restriction endonuclease subunit S [Sphingobacteriaceae bacterium]
MATIKKMPAIRFKGFDKEWGNDKLVNICNTFTDGDWIESKDQSFDGIRLLQTGNIGINKYLDKSNNAKWINEYTFDKLNCKEVLEGDILISRLPEPAGRACIIPNRNIKMITAVDCTIVRPSEKCQSKYLIQFLSSEPYFKEVVNFLAGGTRQRISRGNLANFIVPLPDINEQTQIGNYFKELDGSIQLQEQKLEKVKNLKKAMLEKMFPTEGADVPEIRFKGFAEKWEKKELWEVGKIVGGGTPNTSNKEFWDGSINWYSPTEIGDKVYANESIRKITQLGLEKSSATILPANRTVLFTSRAGIGYMAILKSPGATNQGFQSLVLNEDCDSYFIYSMGFLIRNFALKYASGSTFLEISGKTLEKMPITIPNPTEQTLIGNYFKKLDELIQSHEQKIEQLKHLKQALLQKMFI